MPHISKHAHLAALLFGLALIVFGVADWSARAVESFGGYAPVRATQSAGATLVYASFFAPDNATALPRAETGQEFVALSGKWGVRRYKAYRSDVNGAYFGFLVVETGASDATVRVTLQDMAGDNAQGLVFRATDADNLFFCRGMSNRIEVYRRQAGALTRIGEYNGGIAEDDDLAVELSGASIVVKQNGVLRLRLTDSFNINATRHGLYADTPHTSFKHFTVETGPTSADWIRIRTPGAYQVYQRDAAGKADIHVAGAYSGTPARIEARWKGGAWQLLDAAPRDGAFQGVLKNQSAGQGTFEVRFANDAAVRWRQYYVGIGDVFLVAGQSNAEGRITSPQLYTHPTMRAGVFDEAGRWREAYDPTDSSHTDQHSVWPLLATKIMASQNVPVAFITTGAGATGLLGNGGTWSKPKGSYTACLEMVRRSGVNGLKAVLWYQGETDANLAQLAQADFEAALKKFSADLAGDLHFGPLKIVAAQIGYMKTAESTETRQSVDAVRLGIASAWDAGANILAGPVLYDLDIRMEAGGDGVHLRTPAHARTAAARWWRMLNFHFYGGREGRGPRFGFARQVDGTHIDIGFNLASRSLQPSELPVRGWRVVDASGERKVTSARLQNPTTIRLSLDQPLAGRVQISWASYNDAVGLTLTDNSVEAMPAEPFHAIAQN